MAWIQLSLAAAATKTITDLLYRYLFKRGYSIHQVILFSTASLGLMFAGYLVWLAPQPEVCDAGGLLRYMTPRTGSDFAAFASFGLLSIIGLFCMRYAQRDAPNVGYVRMIGALALVLITVGAYVWLGDHLSPVTALGSAIILVGVGILAFSA